MRPCASVDGHALDAVHAGLELEARIGTVAADLGDDLLVAAGLGVGRGHHLQLPATPLGIAGIHPEQVGGEQRRLLAPGAGTDLEDHVAVVVRIARHEQRTEGRLELGGADLEARELVAGHRSDLLVGIVGHASRGVELLADRAPLAQTGDDRVEAGELATEVGETAGILGGLRSGQLAADLLVARLQLGEPVDHAPGAGAAAASRSEARHDSRLAMLTSSIDRSGGRVVRDCSHRPGA